MSEQSRTPDEKRFIRLIKILLGDVTIKLRQLFRSAYKEKYNKVWENDSTSGKFYMTMVPKPNKREKHMVQIVEQGNTDNFDNSVLFYCLLRSGTDLLLPGVRNKESRVSPFSQSERVDQLRALRNAVVHATAASITEADFNAMVKEIVVIYTELQWDQTQLKEAASGILWAEEYDKLRHQAEMDRARMDDFDQRLKDVEDTSRSKFHISSLLLCTSNEHLFWWCCSLIRVPGILALSQM